jgi:hypothetical protein
MTTVKHTGAKVSQKAATLGNHGPALLFSTPDYEHGTFVQVTCNGAGHKCSIEYKRDNRIQYETNGVGPNVVIFSAGL